MSLIQTLSDLMARRLTLDFMKSDEEFMRMVERVRGALQTAGLILHCNSNLFTNVHNARHISSMTEITPDDRAMALVVNEKNTIPREAISADEFIAQNENMFIALSKMMQKYVEDKCYECGSSEIRSYPSCILQIWVTNLIAGFKIKDPLHLIDRALKQR